MQERRKTVRWSLNRPVLIKQAGKDEDRIRAKASDVSVGGLSFLSETRHPQDEELELAIDVLDKNGYILAKGNIVWQKDVFSDTRQFYVKTGVSFSNITDADKERIFNYAYKFCKDELNKRWWQGLKKEEAEPETNTGKV